LREDEGEETRERDVARPYSVHAVAG